MLIQSAQDFLRIQKDTMDSIGYNDEESIQKKIDEVEEKISRRIEAVSIAVER